MADGSDPWERRRGNREIHVERRRHSTVPWVIGALVLLGFVLVAWLAGGGQDADIDFAAPKASVGTASGSLVTDADLRAADLDASVGDYVRFVGEQRARAAIGRDHDYTAGGIRRLATAIVALAVRDNVAGRALEPRVQALRQRADALQRDPSAETHALKAREAFLLAASVLESIQDRRFPGLDDEAAALRRAAEEVKAREPLTEQADAIDRYFYKAADLFRAMLSADG